MRQRVGEWASGRVGVRLARAGAGAGAERACESACLLCFRSERASSDMRKHTHTPMSTQSKSSRLHVRSPPFFAKSQQFIPLAFSNAHLNVWKRVRALDWIFGEFELQHAIRSCRLSVTRRASSSKVLRRALCNRAILRARSPHLLTSKLLQSCDRQRLGVQDSAHFIFVCCG